MFICFLILHLSTRWTCTLTPQSPATLCSQVWTREPQGSWCWIFLRLREQRPTLLLIIRMDTALLRVHSSYSIFTFLLSESIFHTSPNQWISFPLTLRAHCSPNSWFNDDDLILSLTICIDMPIQTNHKGCIILYNLHQILFFPLHLSYEQEVHQPVLQPEAQYLRWDSSWPWFSTFRLTSSYSR